MKIALTISSVLVASTGTAAADETCVPPPDDEGACVRAAVEAEDERDAVQQVFDRDASPPAPAVRPPSETPRIYVERPRLEKKLSPLATTETWGGGIRLTGLSGIGALPGVNIGGEVAGLVRYQDKFVELGLGRWTPQDEYYVAQGDAIVPLRLDVWAIRAGWASMDMPLRAWLLFEVGELAGAPGMQAMTGVLPRMVMGDTPRERRWQAVGGGFGVAWPISNQARLVGNMELAIPVAKDELMLGNYGAYEPDPLAARYSMGIEVGWR